MSDEDPVEGEWLPEERALLDAALDFFGAAEAVIEFGEEERPRVRRDVEQLQQVRGAMTALEVRVLAAHEAGVATDQITRISRLEPEIVALIIARAGRT